MHVLAVVVGINKTKCTLDLSIKPSYLSRPEYWWISNRHNERSMLRWLESIGKSPETLYDRCFREQDALNELQEEENRSLKLMEVDDEDDAAETDNSHTSQTSKRKALAAKGVKLMMRQVHHPLFVNCGYKEAEDRLIREGEFVNVLVYIYIHLLLQLYKLYFR
jgi:hypothetical protein